MKLYKFLTYNNKGPFSLFDYTEYLPKDGNPGKWLPEITEDLIICTRGYHAIQAKYILNWLNSDLYEVEFRDKPIVKNNIAIGRQFRFVRTINNWNPFVLGEYYFWCVNQFPEKTGFYPGHTATIEMIGHVVNYVAEKIAYCSNNELVTGSVLPQTKIWKDIKHNQTKKLIEMLELGNKDDK